LLRLALGIVLAAGVLEPAFYNFLQEIGNALSLRPGSLLQLALEVRSQTPAIDIGLHALQCTSVRANNAILALSGGKLDAQAGFSAGGQIDLLLDVVGYFQ